MHVPDNFIPISKITESTSLQTDAKELVQRIQRNQSLNNLVIQFQRKTDSKY